MNKKLIALSLAGLLAVGSLSACGTTQNGERQKAQEASQSSGESLEIKNLKKKKLREEDPNLLSYVYIFSSTGVPIGYHVAKGKVSSSASQIGPETEIVYGGGNGNVVDSAKDDGSYGPGDPGIFFFTPSDEKIETSFDYILSDHPMAVDVPRLSK